MQYRFKPSQEFIWFIVVAVGTALFQVLVDFDAATITDWRMWAISVGSGLVRALAAAVIAGFGAGAFGGEDRDEDNLPNLLRADDKAAIEDEYQRAIAATADLPDKEFYEARVRAAYEDEYNDETAAGAAPALDASAARGRAMRADYWNAVMPFTSGAEADPPVVPNTGFDLPVHEGGKPS